MTRKDAIIDIVKNVVIALVIGILATVMTQSSISLLPAFMFGFGGIPAGWKLAGHVITATSIYGIVIKLMFAIILGVFCLIYTLGKDIYYIIANKDPLTINNETE